MLKPLFSLFVATTLFLISGGAVQAQSTEAPPSRLSKVLSHMDFGLEGVGDFNKSVSGTNYRGETVTQQGSNTFGGLFAIRYTKSPWIGFEGDLGYQRLTQKYTCCDLDNGAQANTEEFSVGYVVHPTQTFFGIKPSISAGTGTLAFRPTTFGGQQLHTQARQMYYYSVNGDMPMLADFFALRVGFRQQFYLAPDFGQNYLIINKHTITSQPVIGFIFHF